MCLFGCDPPHIQTQIMGFSENKPILRKDSTDTEWTTSKGVLIVFMSVMNIFMFFGNLLSIVTICYNTKLRRQVSYWFVMNLAVIDLLISVTVVPLNIVWEYYGTWPFSHITCEFFTFADIAFSTISAYSIVLVSIDKYIYITYSIQYFDKMTRKLAIILIIAVWIFVLIFTVISILTEVGTRDDFKDHFLVSNNNTNTCIFVMTDAYVIPSAIISFFLPFGILCFTSSKIVCIASRHIRKIHTISHSLTSDTDSEIMKMAKARNKNHTVTSTTNDSIKPRVNHQLPDIKITPPISTNCQEINAAENTDIRSAGNNDLHKNSSMTILEETVASNGDISKAASDGDITKAVFMTNGSAKMETQKVENGDIPEAGASETVPGDSDSPKTYSKKQRSRSIKSLISRRTDSLKSITLKKTDSTRSSIKRKPSPYCKLFGTVTIVIACFILMFAPYNIAIVADVWCHCIQAWVYEDILAVLYYMHSLVNPYIYMATDRKYKAGLKYLWRKVSKVRTHCQRNKL